MISEKCMMTVLEFQSTTGKRVPKYARQIMYDGTGDENIFLPACIFGDENTICLSAMFDGAQTITNNKHVFIQLSWAKKEFKTEEAMLALSVAENSVKKYISEHHE